jgi:hypothetical protein
MIRYTNEHGLRDYHTPLVGEGPEATPRRRWVWVVLAVVTLVGLLLGALYK